MFKFLLLLFILCQLTSSSYSLQRQARIIAGFPAAKAQFPHHVVLTKNGNLTCGGSIIDKSWVLTSAQCVRGVNVAELTFGTNKLHDPQALHMTSDKIYIHPNFTIQNLIDDIALIKLDKSLTFSDNIKPIRLVSPELRTKPFAYTLATVSGHGLTADFIDETQTSEDLQYALLQIFHNVKCMKLYDENLITAEKLCARGDEYSNMAICNGDIGGALIAKDGEGKWMQLGISSFFAKNMCEQGHPSGFTRVGPYLDFITKVTGIPFNETKLN